MSDARRLERDADLLQTEVAAQEINYERLQTQIVQATGEGMVEDWARSEARMVREGEHLIVPMSAPGSRPQASPTPTPDAIELSAWEVWWALLFDKP
ncbi:MAG: hypothetical protein GTO63_36095 [Anaerolineae bacterium]|nr:hypothetical protein [Anaerolineae bacterium]NIO00175.1 hypothetical protein [Anaerolineae bacterium]